MRVLIGALAVALLAGCATPTMPAMRDRGPVKTFSSVKSPDALAKCVLFAWQDSKLSGGGMVMAMQPGRNGGSTVYAGDREYFADITPTGTGSSVKYYAISNNWVSRDLQEPMTSCL